MAVAKALAPLPPPPEPVEDDDNGINAATGYVTLLFAAVADLYAQEARVPLVLTDLVVLVREDNPMGDGACCYDTTCLTGY